MTLIKLLNRSNAFRGCGMWLLWGLVVLGGGAAGLCPSVCLCTDETLTASCSHAGLQVVPIQLNPDLRRIDLPGNKITAVHDALGFYGKLKHLDVSRNSIKSLGGKNFEAQVVLHHLNVSHNHITALGKDTFRGLKAVRVVDLSYNQIEIIEERAFRDTVELELLDLSHNQINTFESPSVLSHVKALRVLYLNGNEIADFPTELLKNLKTPCALEVLKLSENLIETLEDKAFPSPCTNHLRVLTLGSNVIKYIDRSAFNPLHSLAVLDLSFNNLTSVPTQQLSKLSRLNELDLSGNTLAEVRSVAFESLFSLRTLRLSSMPHMNRIDPRAFVDNTQLEVLYVEENPELRKIPDRLFKNNPSLVHLSFRRNSLTTLAASNFPLDRLRSLDVTENPLHCNCSLLWLISLARFEARLEQTQPQPLPPPSPASNETSDDGQPLRMAIHRLKCASPEPLREQDLSELTENSVRCETSWLTVAVVTALVLALFGATCVALLLFGGSGRACRTKAEAAGSESAPQHPTRLTLQAVPAPVLMLMPPPQHQHRLEKAAEALNGDLPNKYTEPWIGSQPCHLNEYAPDLTSRKPHIVYV